MANTILSAITPARHQEVAAPQSPPLARRTEIAVGLLTGGIDRHYSFGLMMALISKGVRVDVIGSDGIDSAEMHTTPCLNFLNLQENNNPAASTMRIWRLVEYYARLIRYAWESKAKIFHILWNNKFVYFDRTLLTLYYRLLGKKVVLTAHNINAAKLRPSAGWASRRVTGRFSSSATYGRPRVWNIWWRPSSSWRPSTRPPG
jgi:hypothetical protein